ncbi:MAG: phosphoglucomutase/phosphomannomutase family protein [Acidobacteriia bacterium]|nr:phosphoglucomutase/phosphomannomutase family protein [Terriglobia bacterium]
MSAIVFGTDGWRGVIGDDFTFANVRRVVRAIARYVNQTTPRKPVLTVGYDTRFGSPEFARVAAETLSQQGIEVLLSNDYVASPILSFAVRHFRTAGGIMITASHNPAHWNGVKFKGTYGGSANPAIIRSIEKLLPASDRETAGVSSRRPQGKIRVIDFKRPYREHLKRTIDFKKLRNARVRVIVDAMYGAGRGTLRTILSDLGIVCQEIRGEINPSFGGVHPEPIESNLAELRAALQRTQFDVGFASDGDADRIGAMDGSGLFVDSHKIFSMILEHLVATRQMKGEVAKTFSSTKMIDQICRRFSIPMHETPIGFKYICDLMLTRKILIGGEESGGIGVTRHLPERDSVLCALLMLEIMITRKKTLREVVSDLMRQYGSFYFDRLDLHLTEAQKQRAVRRLTHQPPRKISNYAVARLERLDGFKFLFSDTEWVLVRPSGTEPILRLYCEASSPQKVKRILTAAKNLVSA